VLIVGHDRFLMYYDSELTSTAVLGWFSVDSTGTTLPQESRRRMHSSNPLTSAYECLNENVFLSLAESRATIEAWRDDYNHRRPHSRLGALTPVEFV
jgi:putative transposase